MPIDPLREIWLPMLYGQMPATAAEFRKQAASAGEHGFVGLAADLWHAANEVIEQPNATPAQVQP